jgi:hypothetical protein
MRRIRNDADFLQWHAELTSFRLPSILARVRGYMGGVKDCPRCLVLKMPTTQMKWLQCRKGNLVGRYCIGCDYAICWKWVPARVATDEETVLPWLCDAVDKKGYPAVPLDQAEYQQMLIEHGYRPPR